MFYYRMPNKEVKISQICLPEGLLWGVFKVKGLRYLRVHRLDGISLNGSKEKEKCPPFQACAFRNPAFSWDTCSLNVSLRMTGGGVEVGRPRGALSLLTSSVSSVRILPEVLSSQLVLPVVCQLLHNRLLRQSD